MNEAWIIDACRTPRGIGKLGKGALADLHPQHLGAVVLKALLIPWFLMRTTLKPHPWMMAIRSRSAARCWVVACASPSTSSASFSEAQ